MMENKKVYMLIDAVNIKPVDRHMDIFAFSFKKRSNAFSLSLDLKNKSQNDGEN